MSLPTSEPLLPAIEHRLSPSRRRRKGRMLIPEGAAERSDFLEQIAHQSTPSFDFFWYSFLSGLVLAGAILIDSPLLYLIGILLAPFLAPLMGLSLATAVGSGRFFFQASAGMVLGNLLTFFCGVLSGWVANSFYVPTHNFELALSHTRFTWSNFTLLTTGMCIIAFLLVRNPRALPEKASVLLVHSLNMPLIIAGFGLVTGVPDFWPNALLVFIAYWFWCILIGTIIFALLHLRPLTAFGYALGSILAVISLSAVAIYYNLGGIQQYFSPITILLDTPTPLVISSPTLLPSETPTQTPTFTPTLQPTNTVLPSNTPSPVPTATALPTATLPAATATTPARTAIIATRTQTSSATHSPQPSPTPTFTLTLTTTPTTTLTITPSPSPTLTFTASIAPQPTVTQFWAIVSAGEGQGAWVRSEPSIDATPIKTLINGTPVQVLEIVTRDERVWAHIRVVKDNLDGWMMRSLLTTATPVPGRN